MSFVALINQDFEEAVRAMERERPIRQKQGEQTMDTKKKPIKKIVVGDNGHNNRGAGNRGELVAITRMPKPGMRFLVGDRLHVVWKDEFELEDGGIYFVDHALPSDRRGYQDVFLRKSAKQS